MGVAKQFDHEKIIALHVQGVKDMEIADELGCAKSTVSVVLSRWRRGNKMLANRQIDEGKVWALAWGGWNLENIADECGCSTSEAAAIIRKRMPSRA